MNTRILRTDREVYSIDAIRLVVRECAVLLAEAKRLIECAMRGEPVVVQAREPSALVLKLARFGVVAEVLVP